MPIPGTSEAPRFDGHYLAYFLEDLELHFARASITDEDRQVNYITRYSTEAIRKRIMYLPELDRNKTGKKWEDAKATLLDLYGDVDKPRPLSLAEFHKWVQSAADKPAFVSKTQVNAYYTDFMARGQPLLDAGQISENDMAFSFIQGVPTSMKPALRSLIPDAQRTRSNPSKIKDTLALLRGLANKDDPTYEAWRYEDAAADNALLAEPPVSNTESSVNTTDPRPSHPSPATSGPSAKSSSSIEDQMDSLMKQFSEMKIMLAQQAQNPNAVQQQTRPPRCVMCGATNVGHSMRSCPETLKLVSEGRIRLDAAKNRYVLSVDGSDLPRAPYNYDGGLAAYIRAQTPSPPSTHSIVVTHGAGLVLGDGVSFSTLLMPYAIESYPALRGGKEYENRYDPKKRPNDKPAPRQRVREGSQQHVPIPQAPAPAPTSVPAPSPPPPTQPTPAPLPAQAPVPGPIPSMSQPIPEPPHPINRKDGWKQSQPRNKGKNVRVDDDSDVEMRDGPSPPKVKQQAPSSGYKHATDLESRTDANAVFDALLKDVTVTLPLGKILGTSSSLQDLMHEATKRRRVPKDDQRGAADGRVHAATSLCEDSHAVNVSKAEVLHFDASGVPIVQAEYTTASSFRDYVLVDDGHDTSQQQLAFATFALSRTKGLPAINDRMFAMATGVFTTHVNGVPFRCMVDSGSELNVAYRAFPNATGLALDSLGQFWRLKGIHGEAEPLAGYVDSVPFQIGRHTFEHHVFVSPHNSIGDSFDIILGQPFLAYFDARVDYSATGETVLYLWSGRDKDTGRRPTLGISITDPEDARNRSEILSHVHPTTVTTHVDQRSGNTRTSARIEEVRDEDDEQSDFA